MLARFDAQGALTSYSAELFGGYVRNMALQRDGKLIVVGDISRVGFHRANGVARLNPDGSFDPTFQPYPGQTAAPGVVAIQPDGKVLLSTWIASVVRRFNTDGSEDPAFTRIVANANAIALQPDGKIVVAGLLSATAGGHTLKNLARYNVDGTIDTTFRPPAFDSVLTGVMLARDGSIYVGRFDQGAQSALVKLKADGTLDTSFTPHVTGTVTNMVEEADGHVLLAGSVYGVNGVQMPQPVRLQANGTADPLTSVYSGMTVYSVALLNDGSVVAGGNRATVTGGLRAGLARYSPPGVLQAQPNYDFRSPAVIYAATRLPSGKFMVFGRFEAVGSTTTKNVARLNADGSVDGTFSSSATANQFFPSVKAARGMPDGRVAIGGDLQYVTFSKPVALLLANGVVDSSFTMASTALTSVSAIDMLPSGKLVVGGKNAAGQGGVLVLNLDGTVDASFGGGTPFDNEVSHVVALTDGSVLVGGNFQKHNTTTTGALVRLKSDGSLDAGFTSPNFFSVEDLVVAVDGPLYVVGGSSDPGVRQHRLSRLKPNGSLDASFQPPDAGLYRQILLQPDGKLIASADPTSGGPTSMLRLKVDGTADPSFRAVAVYPQRGIGLQPIWMLDDGSLFYNEGTGAANRFRRSIAVQSPFITGLPGTQTLPVGGSVTLSAAVSSALPTTYQWTFEGQPIAGATSASYTVTNFSGARAGTYALLATNEIGTTTSGAVVVAGPKDTRGHLINLSVRANSGSGSGRLIVGAVVGGAGTGGNKALLFRAAGPTLAIFGVPGVHPDPMLEIYDQNQVKVDQNDDWRGVFDFRTVGAFPFDGAQPKDAAIYNPYVTNGGQTMHVVGKGDAGGVVLAEIYDATPSEVFSTITPRLINGSARTSVGAGADALILGFVIGGESSQRVLVRAAGPTLGAPPYNLGGVLADPTLEIFNANDIKIASNDNWGSEGTAASLTATFASVYAFNFESPASKDAALVLDLPPGRYTAVVRGTNGSTGIALVELYDVP